MNREQSRVMTEPLPEGFVLWTQQKERLDRILELVSNGQSVAITGDYRSGKTTLLLAAEREIDKQPGRRAVYIDAARISDPEQLYLDIITAIIGSDAPDDFDKALRSRPTRDVLQDPISKLRLTGEEVTICLDEVSQSLENLDKKHALELSLLIQASAEQTGITYIIALSQSINQRLEPEFAKTLSRFEKIQVHSIRKGTLNYTNNDRPSGTDRLNFREYVTALSKLVSSEHTAPPLTVGIYGPWGSGKSFLMRKLRQELEDNTRYQFEFLTIDFNAWVYSGSEYLWAGLVTRLYEKVEDRFTGSKLGIKRFCRKFKSRGWWVLLRILAMISVAPIIVYSTSVDNVYWQVSLALVASIAGLAGLSAIPANLKGVSQLFAAAFQNGSTWLRTLILAPDFRDHIGFMADVKSEIDLMKQVIADNDTDKPVRIAVFIDDLDRCPPTKAAEVLQAVMLLLSEESPQESDNSKSSNERGELRPNPFVIFLAIDTRIIANAIEEHYGKAIVKIGVTGYEYLDKVVQLPFAIPVPSEEDIRRYLDSMLANPSQERKTDEISGSPPKQLENEGVSPSTSEDTDQQVNHREQKDEADLISIAFTDFEKETFKRNIPFLNPNPRNLKRLINVYRLERLIADKRISANKLIDWVILTEQWPVLTSIVIALIKSAEHATKTEVDIRGIPLSEMYKRAEAALESDSLKHLSQLDWDYTTLRAFLQINQPSVRMTDLQTLKPITTNINPAILENVNRSLSTSE